MTPEWRRWRRYKMAPTHRFARRLEPCSSATTLSPRQYHPYRQCRLGGGHGARSGVEQPAISLQIFAAHLLHGKAAFKAATDNLPIQRGQAFHGARRLLGIVHEETG